MLSVNPNNTFAFPQFQTISQFNLPNILTPNFDVSPIDNEIDIAPENVGLPQDAFDLWCKTNPLCQVWQNSGNESGGIFDRFEYVAKNSILLLAAVFIFGLGVYLITRQAPIVGKYVP